MVVDGIASCLILIIVMAAYLFLCFPIVITSGVPIHLQKREIPDGKEKIC